MKHYLTLVCVFSMRLCNVCFFVVLVTLWFKQTVAQSACAVNTYPVTLNPAQNAARRCGVNKNQACPSYLSSIKAGSIDPPASGNDGNLNSFAHTNNYVTSTAANPHWYMVDFTQTIHPSSVIVSVTHIPSRLTQTKVRLGSSNVWSENSDLSVPLFLDNPLRRSIAIQTVDTCFWWVRST